MKRRFDKVLIANRGEIALRILRACRLLDLKTVVVHSEADRAAGYVGLADQAVCIGPAPAARSYLNPAALLLAAGATGAQAIHPGYGFLSEDAAFAERVEAHGLTFIGPSASLDQDHGRQDRGQARHAGGRRAMRSRSEGALPDDAAAVGRIAAKVGYPVIIKAAGGGGGRGMRVVRFDSELADAVAITRAEARRAFANPDLYLEKFLEIRGTSRSRSCAMRTARRCGWAIATARCSDATRRSSRRRRRRASIATSSRASVRAAPRPAGSSAIAASARSSSCTRMMPSSSSR